MTAWRCSRGGTRTASPSIGRAWRTPDTALAGTPDTALVERREHLAAALGA